MLLDEFGAGDVPQAVGAAAQALELVIGAQRIAAALDEAEDAGEQLRVTPA
jgi:hypothetical protein